MRHIFIINPAAGKKDISERIRAEIEAVCARRGIAPLIFISEYNGYELFIANKMCSLFTDEDIRFYCVGGSGTLTQTLSGMDDGQNRQIACYPCGLSNDFLKCYEGNIRAFRNIESLLDGRVDALDYIKVMGCCKVVDFVNIGLGNVMFESETFYTLLSDTSSAAAYSVGVAHDILRSQSAAYDISIDGTDYSGTYAMVLCMNGRVLGSKVVPSEECRPDDGVMNIFLFRDSRPWQSAGKYIKLYMGKYDTPDELFTMVRGRRMIITRKDHTRMLLNCDGDGFTPEETTLDIRLVPAGVNFVVPQHAALREPTK
jgi:diacylglycerol kinase family enzyme